MYLDYAQEIPALHKTPNEEKHAYLQLRMLLNNSNISAAFALRTVPRNVCAIFQAYIVILIQSENNNSE